MTVATPIIEIFSSLQGEGTRLGERHLFVRFQGCSIGCQYCDTPTSFIQNEYCRVERVPFTKQFENYPNPVSIRQLNEILSDFTDVKVLSITGGEPLESTDFLVEWLPTLQGRYQILLETAGIHYEELARLLPWINIISMDLKLPSVTGVAAQWEAHRRFITLGRDKELYIKVVVSAATKADDWSEAVRLVAAANPMIPFILQPASDFAAFRQAPALEQLAAWQVEAQQVLQDVRVIPQLHKMLRVL